MSSEELYRVIDDPSLLSQDTLPVLRQMTEDYPWFSTARMLYLKNLTNVESPVFGEELKKHAVYVADRKKLYDYIHLDIEEITTESAATIHEDDPFLLIDSFLTAQGTMASFPAGMPLPIQPSASMDYILWAYSHTGEAEKEKEPEPIPLKHQELIDSFLTEEVNREPGIRLLQAEEEEDRLPSLVEDEEYEKTLDDSYFTETLARIYVKQRRYEKALQIIQKLSLKYPEKNIYFADQIRFLEKLIINTKK
ncbi:MAG: hypothetical protein LUH15_14595 [Tannerellaceae bacterium]|nr:hypothetical protein [Tannerellaceae bacterium]